MQPLPSAWILKSSLCAACVVGAVTIAAVIRPVPSDSEVIVVADAESPVRSSTTAHGAPAPLALEIRSSPPLQQVQVVRRQQTTVDTPGGTNVPPATIPNPTTSKPSTTTTVAGTSSASAAPTSSSTVEATSGLSTVPLSPTTPPTTSQSTTTTTKQTVPPTVATSTTVAPQPSRPEQSVLLAASFEGVTLGPLTRGDLESLFNHDLRYAAGPGELSVRDGYLLQTYVPSERGSPVVEFPTRGMARHEELWLSYDVYFEPGFEWVMGGKLPGLAGGAITTGGNGADGTDGFTARLAWQPEGRLVVYAYHPDRPGRYGETLPIAGSVTPGSWNRIVQRVWMNTGDQFDGGVEVWVNGELGLSKDDMRWRTTGDFGVETFIYSSFYGGNSPMWAPSTTTRARFDNFLVTTQRPDSFKR